ncbi:hypothetical protein [Ideonella sp. B508-1]|uniref:hypothetical protein n=1 Tax=Ideonella sp. B508-1 TaxID=137716 RepID=UPI00034A6596
MGVCTLSSFAQTAAPAPVATGASKPGTWKKDHPYRAEVNQRLKNQDKRIHEEVADGKLTHAQAAKLHKEDRQVRQEERDMASQDHGHITAQEKKTLNQQENKISHQIGH